MSVLGVYVGATQRTASYDTVRIQEEDRIFEEFATQTHDLCNSITPPVIKEHFRYELTRGFGSENLKRVRQRYGDSAQAEAPQDVSFYAELIKPLDGPVKLSSPPTQFVEHPVFPTMLRLSTLLAYRSGEPTPRFIWDVYADYNDALAIISRSFDGHAIGDSVPLNDIATAYFNAEVACYLSLKEAIDGYYSRVQYNQPRVEFWLGSNNPIADPSN